MRMNDLDYREDTEIFRGLIAYDDTASGKQPGVLVFHEGLGLGEHIIERTRRIAKLGYVALAADMFGDRRQARDLEDMRRLVGDLRNDPTKLRARGRAALATLASQPQVDAGKLCAIGFCFGGSVVLELARDGADLKAVVSFHGVLATKAPALPGKVGASVLVLTGADDPLAPPDHVAAFENEMRGADVRNWQVITYGNPPCLHQSCSGRVVPVGHALQRAIGPQIVGSDEAFLGRGHSAKRTCRGQADDICT